MVFVVLLRIFEGCFEDHGVFLDAVGARKKAFLLHHQPDIVASSRTET
jgi:hypothetical protein